MANAREDLQDFLTPDYVDLSAIPAPKVIEELSFGDIFDELLIDFKKRNPSYDALLESDPAIIVLECYAYRETLLRHRINEAAKANLLAYAAGSDLDNLAAFYGIERMVVDTGDPNATPPVRKKPICSTPCPRRRWSSLPVFPARRRDRFQ
ncbi:hypothetical protein RsTz2092_12860 [Deferribacterales bacterium RsTz2092]|nr:hypothetical protein AGMMS49941_12580 [Deferribacterales bacterium]